MFEKNFVEEEGICGNFEIRNLMLKITKKGLLQNIKKRCARSRQYNIIM